MKRGYTEALILALAVFVFMMASPVKAQREMPSVDERIEELDKAVKLTSDQEKKIREYYEEQAEQMRQMTDQRRNSRRRGRDDADNADNNTRQNNNNRDSGNNNGPRPGRGGFGGDRVLEEILTADQMEKYRSYRREQGLIRSLNRYEEQLGLDAGQKEKVKAILAEQAKETESMFARGQDMSQDERREMFQKMQEFREKYNQKIAALLNADQKKKFDEMNEEMRNRMRGRQQ